MPTLHIRALPNDNGGITKVRLSNDIRSQNLRLLMVVIHKPNANYSGDNIGVRLPFLSSNQFHSTLRKGELTFPTDKHTKYTQLEFGSGLPLECDHIDEAMEIVLVDQDGAGITSTANVIDFVDLYFSYETHSLF